MEIFQVKTTVPGTSLAVTSDLLVSNDSVLNEFDVSAENLSISDGTFFVTFSLPADNAAPMVDKSTPLGEANFVYGDVGSGNQWYSFKQLGTGGPKGNWVVRIDVDVPGDDGGVADAGQDGGNEDSSAGGSAGAGGQSGSAGAAGAGGMAGASQPAPPPTQASGGCAMTQQRTDSFALVLIGLAALIGARKRSKR
jgi:hypothetical protein